MERAITTISGPITPQPILRPEVLDAETTDPRIAHVEALARWMDYAFVLPGGFRFGLAGFIDLIPGFGDIVDALISLYIVASAVQLGIPRVTLTRMVLNVGIESAAGSLPFVGTLFDVVFKANRRNYLLLKSHVTQPGRRTTNDWVFVVLAGLLLAVGIALPVIALIEIGKHL